MTQITQPDWLNAFGEAVSAGDREGALRALESQATGHAGTAPTAEKRAAVKETLARVPAEALPGIANWYAPLHHYQPAVETVKALREAGFSRVEERVIHYTDMVDGSFQALKHQPELLLDDEHILNTAVLMRVPEQGDRDDPPGLRQREAARGDGSL